MKRKIVRLTESDLHRIVENSVKRVLNESEYGQTMCSTNVECYDKNDDIVFVCVPTDNDDKAMSFCERALGFEAVSCSDGWCWERGQEDYNENNLLLQKYCILDRPATSSDDLDGYFD